MGQKKYFELLNGEVIPDEEVKVYIFSFKSFKNRKYKYEKDKSTQSIKEEHPLSMYFAAFHNLCQDKKAQNMLNETNWCENDELRKFFQNKVNSIEADRNRDAQYAMLRENIHKLSKKEKIEYRPGGQITEKSKDKKNAYFSFNSSPYSEEFDDSNLNFLKKTSLDLNCAFQKHTTNIKIIAELAHMTWEHIYNHHENIEKNIKPPWVSIRTLKAYILHCCSHENILRLFGKRLEDGHESLDAPIGDSTETLGGCLSSEINTLHELEVITVSSSTNELVQEFLKKNKKYELIICIFCICEKHSATVIDKIRNEHRKAATQINNIKKNIQNFMRINDLVPYCSNYEEGRFEEFYHALKDPCYNDILPRGCPKYISECVNGSDISPCSNVS